MKKMRYFVILSLIFIMSFSIFLVYPLITTTSNKGTLSITDEHPFFVNGKWVEASDLNVGDLLLREDGKKARITRITDVSLDEPILVYNLEIEGYENYVANGILVHNSNNPI